MLKCCKNIQIMIQYKVMSVAEPVGSQILNNGNKYKVCFRAWKRGPYIFDHGEVEEGGEVLFERERAAAAAEA